VFAVTALGLQVALVNAILAAGLACSTAMLRRGMMQLVGYKPPASPH
jgi:hypothetical protein